MKSSVAVICAIWCTVGVTMVLGQGPAGAGGGAGGAAAAAAGMMAGGAGIADLMNPMGVGRPFVPGMTANQVADLMGGRPGPVPMDIANEALALRMAGWTPDQIADVLGDKLQARYGNPMLAMAMNGGLPGGGPMMPGADPMMLGAGGNPMAPGAIVPTPTPTGPTAPTPQPTRRSGRNGRRNAGVVSRGATKSPRAQRPPKPTQAPQADAFGVISRMPQMQMPQMPQGNAGAGGMPGAMPVDPNGAMVMGMMNPMGPGRPFVPGMTPNQVSDLMGGRPGPVPMDIAQEALALRMAGWTPDQIADVLGDKLSRRYSNPFGAAMEAQMMNSITGGATGGTVDPFMAAFQGMTGIASSPTIDFVSAFQGTGTGATNQIAAMPFMI